LTYYIIIGLAALIGLFRLFRTTDNFARIILIGQILAIGFTLLAVGTVTAIGLQLFMLTLVLTIIYGLTKNHFHPLKRILIVVPAILVLVIYFFQLQRYPGAGLLGLTMALPIIAYLILLTTDVNNYKNEIGFLTIIAAAAAIEFIRRFDGSLIK
jgi:hypothetical protein